MANSIEIARRNLRNANLQNPKEVEELSENLTAAYDLKTRKYYELSIQKSTTRKILGVNHQQHFPESRKHHISPWTGGVLTNSGYRRY